MNALDEAIARAPGGAEDVARRARKQAAIDLDVPVVRRLDFVAAEDLDDADVDFDDELVEGVIGRSAMAVMYGDSNSGKTFAAISMGAAVCRGGTWLGRNTVPGLVLYLATEAAGSVQLRLKAYRRHYGEAARGFVIVQSPVNLFDGEADVNAILSTVSEIESLYGEKVLLIIGDTLARIAAGANENSGEDMGTVLRHADAIRAATGATFLWVHHTGKDQARGMRGWSGMRAAIDTEIEVTADDVLGTRAAEITKQRDLPGKGQRLGFRLEVVPLGRNRWGSERSSCVAVDADAPPKALAARKTPAGEGPCAKAVIAFLAGRGSGCRRADLVERLSGEYSRATVHRSIKDLLSVRRLTECVGIVALLGEPVSSPSHRADS